MDIPNLMPPRIILEVLPPEAYVRLCAICGGAQHEGECPPVATITAVEFGIADNVPYDGRRKPDFVEDDDKGWPKP